MEIPSKLFEFGFEYDTHKCPESVKLQKYVGALHEQVEPNCSGQRLGTPHQHCQPGNSPSAVKRKSLPPSPSSTAFFEAAAK